VVVVMVANTLFSPLLLLLLSKSKKADKRDPQLTREAGSQSRDTSEKR
jgi:hypothetical protein